VVHVIVKNPKLGLNWLMLCRENHRLFFPDTVYIIAFYKGRRH